MLKVVYDRNELKSYKEFYERIYDDMDGKNMIDWETFDCLGYSADNLNEFLWYCHKDNFHIIFKNFDLKQIENSETAKNYENYKWKLIFEVFQNITKKYPNNRVEFVND